MTIKKTKHSRKKKKKKPQPKKKEKEKNTNINMLVRLTVNLISWYMFFSPNISYQSYDLFFLNSSFRNLKTNTCQCVCASDLSSYNGLIIYL